MTHVLTLTQMYNAVTSTLFKVTLFLNILLGVSALGLLVGDGIYLISAIFKYFEIILTEEISNFLAQILLFTILGTTMISFLSLIIGPIKILKK